MRPPKDPWHYPRDTLAQQIMGMFDSGLASALTLFAPRRKGKTEFLRKDITPLAEEHGWRVFYFSFLDAGTQVQHDFVQALADFSQPTGLLQRASQYLNKIGKVSGEVGSVKAEVELHDRTTAQTDLLGIIKTLAEGKQPALLLLDEIQALAHKQHASLIAQLRTALDMHKDRVKVIFTGSSREGLRRMFSTSTAPFFHFGQNLEFPDLGQGFTDHLADTYHTATQRHLDKAQLWQAFVDMQRSPQFARALVERLTLNPLLTIDTAQQQLMQDITLHQDFAGLWRDLSPLEQLILKALACGEPEPYSQTFRTELAHTLGLGDVPVATSTMQNTLRAMQRKNLIHAQGQGRYVIEDALFADWIRHE